LTEPTQAQAAIKAGVSEATLHRCVRLPDFAAAHRRACRQLVERTIGRIQGVSEQVVHTLLAIAKDGKKDNDWIGPHPCSGEA
jgi:hypothetical protein